MLFVNILYHYARMETGVEIFGTYVRRAFFAQFPFTKAWTNSSTVFCSARWIINGRRVLRAQLLHIQREGSRTSSVT